MFDPAHVDSMYYHIMGEKSGCMTCVEFVAARLPGWSFDNYCRHIDKHDASAVEMKMVMGIANSEERTAHKPAMKPSVEDFSTFEMYEKRAVLNHNQVIAEYGKMPASLRLQPYAVPSTGGTKVIYIVERHDRFKGKYPTLKMTLGSKDGVEVTRMSPRAQKALCPSHPSHALKGLGFLRDTMQDDEDLPGSANIVFGMGVPTHDELLKRVETLDSRNTKRASKPKTATSMADDSDDVDGSQSSVNANQAGVADEPELVPDDGAVSVSSKLTVTPLKRGGSQSSLVPNKKGKLESSGSSVETNPYELGSADFWIFELKFDQAFDGETLGRALHQSKVLVPKLDQDARKSLLTRIGLIEKAKNMAFNLVIALDDHDLLDLWTDLRKANATQTPKLRIALYERYAKKMVGNFAESGNPAEKRRLLAKLISKTQMWGERINDVFNVDDVLEPSMTSTLASDKILAKLFSETLFSGIMVKLIGKGEPGVEDTLAYASILAKSLELPEEADIGDECAKVFLEAEDVLAVLPVLAFEAITQHTDVRAFAIIKALDEASVRTENCSGPLCTIGAAVRHSSWWQHRLSTISKSLPAFLQHGKHIKTMHEQLKALPEDIVGSPIAVHSLQNIAEAVEYWEASSSTLNMCIVLKKDLLQVAEHLASALIAQDTTTFDQAAMDARLAQLSECEGLYTTLRKIFPCDACVPKTQAAFNRIKTSMDLGAKHRALAGALGSWEARSDDMTRKLVAAFDACAGHPVPVECSAVALSLWTSVVKQLAHLNDSVLGPQEERNLCEIVFPLAQHLPPPDNSVGAKIALWLTAAWNLKSEIRTACLIDDNADGADVNVACQTLMRSVSTTLSLGQSVATVEAAKAAVPEVAKLVEAGKAKVATIGLKLRSTLEIDIDTWQQKLSNEVEGDAHYTTFAAFIETATDINEIKANFGLSFKLSNPEGWVGAAAQLEAMLKSLDNKTSEFDLPPIPDLSSKCEKTVKEARVAFCISSIMNALTGDLASDKVGLRKVFRGIAANLKVYRLKPTDLISEAILTAYKNGLAMKGE